MYNRKSKSSESRSENNEYDESVGDAPSKRNKKVTYLRHFPNVVEEEVLRRYPCALVIDFLRQGYLYVTKNYLAFHSNIFGYVTKLLIPLLSIEEITKEKTAKIIPNAIGIQTAEGKHTFSSFLSRDRTLAFIMEVWNQAKRAETISLDSYDRDSDYSMCSSEEEIIEETDIVCKQVEIAHKTSVTDPVPTKNTNPKNTNLLTSVTKKPGINTRISKERTTHFILYYAAIILIVLLFLSAAVLLHRIVKVYNLYSYETPNESEKMYYKELKQFFEKNPEMLAKSFGSIHNFAEENIKHVSSVRKSLESIYSVLSSESEKQDTNDFKNV
ncbi:protein Aster-B-like [Diabrotica virgifera virgifera]|uniref:GRAM domain-containing protein n=1 Tax=Diabrotica virgifera virgifera TaxID=50390 RepID=A0ABM5KWE3_DIAVI|nr:protein Aster-B-like [Diabrotica virgifera virgifera]